MSRCEIYGDCWFYKSTIDPQSQAFELLQKYCHGDYSACARYQFSLSLGNFYVPKGLLPNDVRRIKPVLRSLIWENLLRILPFTRGGQIYTFSAMWESASPPDEFKHLTILSYKKWDFICHMLNSPIDWDLSFHYFIEHNTISILNRLLLKKKLRQFCGGLNLRTLWWRTNLIGLNGIWVTTSSGLTVLKGERPCLTNDHFWFFVP